MSQRMDGRSVERRRAGVLLALATWLTVATGAGATGPAAVAAPAQSESSLRSVREGVYTNEQAERGAIQYRSACEHCHLQDLGGSPVEEAPSLIRDAFLARWQGKTARDLFDTISKTMPADRPASLSRREYVDLIAYILQVNAFPPGPRELDRDPEVIRRIIIDPPAAAGAR